MVRKTLLAVAMVVGVTLAVCATQQSARATCPGGYYGGYGGYGYHYGGYRSGIYYRSYSPYVYRSYYRPYYRPGYYGGRRGFHFSIGF